MVLTVIQNHCESNEIIQTEEKQWLKEVLAGIRAGEKDIALISNYPVARTKFYDVKNS